MRRLAAVMAALCAGCAGSTDPIGSMAAHDAVVDVYHKEVQFSAPRACDIHLEQRVVDEKARTVEYDAHVGGNARSIVYSVVAGDAYPLQVALFDEKGGNTFSVLASDHALRVVDPAGNALITVDGYDGDQAHTTIAGLGSIDDADGLSLLGCALDDRTSLGSVPAFLRNLSSGGQVPGQPDVG